MRATTRLRRSRSLGLLAVAVGALFLAVPLLALNCEVACARDAVPAATAEGGQTPAAHCASHGDASPERPSGAPPAPDRCGHRADSGVVKRVADDAASGWRTSTLAGFLEVQTACAFDRSADSSAPAEAAAGALRAAARSSILRL